MYNDFPLPSIPLPAPIPSLIDSDIVASTPPSTPARQVELPYAPLAEAELEALSASQSSSKENDVPAEAGAENMTALPPLSHRNQQAAILQDSVEAPAGTLPPDLLSLYNTSTRLLEHDFAQSPPYTIQRLAELVIHPRKHYRFLPAYLRALDRVVSVSSPISNFPLSTVAATANGGFLTNGDSNQVNGTSDLGSDESLGGALLTPIPWLRNNGASASSSNGSGSNDGELHSESTETIEGPNGAGSIETVSVTVNGIMSATTSIAPNNSLAPASPTLSDQSDASSSGSPDPTSTDAQLRQQGGVTQGELLRQEQEAGVVPVSQHGPRRALIPGGGAAAVGRDLSANGVPRDSMAMVMDEDGPAEEHPHARGPEEVGMEDMGPQQPRTAGSGELDMEAAVGRGKSPPLTLTPMMMEPLYAEPYVQPSQVMGEVESAGEGEVSQGLHESVSETGTVGEAEDVQAVDEAKDADGDIEIADAQMRPVDTSSS